MTNSEPVPQFNALTDAWLPLVQNDGSTLWASPVEVLCGEKDGVDLDYPRDDFRVYARLLFSALVQALFPARDKRELEARLELSLTRAAVEARIKPVRGDFDLFGTTPFLQIVPPNDPAKTDGAAPFVFGAVDIYQPAVAIEAVSMPIALVTIFIEQTYAGGAGRGYGAGPGGQPGAFTLIDAGSIRTTAWANTLTIESASGKYHPDKEPAWSNVQLPARPRASIGLVEGLFFQPRGIWLIPVGQGTCSFSGQWATLVRLSPFLPKSKLTEKPSKGEDTWVHPCAPMAVNSQGLAAIRLNAERPVWTGLAQLLAPMSKEKAKLTHPLEKPAQVLTQWRTLVHKTKALHLIILDFDRDKANIRRRFFEGFQLSSDLVEKPEVVDLLRMLITNTENISHALEKAIASAHDDRKHGGLALADARSSFWATSETPFFAWLSAVIRPDEGTDAGWAQIHEGTDAMLNTLRRTAMSIFNTHAELSEFDPRKQECVAKARRSLLKALWPKQTPRTSTTQPAEVSP